MSTMASRHHPADQELAPNPPGRELDKIPDLIRAVRQIPMHMRRFQLTARQARSLHRVDDDLLDLLVAEGLPVVGTGPDRLFDDYDLGNVALHLGLMSVRRMAIRAWSNALRRNSERAVTRCRVGYVPTCPTPGHADRCEFDLLMPGGHRVPARGAGDGASPLAHLDLELRSEWPELPPAAGELVEECDALRFFILPEAIRWDLDFLRRTGLADCGGVAEALVAAGRRRGISVRFAFGLLVAKPYSTPHCWAEFEVDGVWVPHDPLLLRAMRTWGSLTPAAWPSSRSPGAIFSRLSDRFTKVASHRGLWSAVSLPTEYLS